VAKYCGVGALKTGSIGGNFQYSAPLGLLVS
jgi:hypothetical protein